MKLRDYQIKAIDKIDNDLETDNHILLQAIMGAGKTFIVCKLIEKYYNTTNRNFLVLAHKQELVEQFKKTFTNMTNIHENDIGIICSGLNKYEINKRIIIGTIQTVINIINKFKFINLLVIDEAHRIDIDNDTQYNKVIKYLKQNNPNLRILGITATPYRLGHGYIYGNKCIGNNLFKKLNYHIKYNDLRKSGYLMDLNAKIAINDSFNNDIKSIQIKGDYNIKQLGELMSKNIHINTAIDAINKYCMEYNHICIFCCTIEHAEIIKNLIGSECTIIHSRLSPSERKNNLHDWKTGKKRIITSINILVEGFDFPELDCLVMIRPTMSTALYLQAVGRVLRIAENKNKAFLLDLTNNTEKFGSDLDNIFVNIPRKIKSDIENKLFKDCPNCKEQCHIACYECQNCGYIFKNEITEAESLPEMKDIKFNEPIIKNVFDIVISKHKKHDKPDSIRIDYHNDNPYNSLIASEWLFFDHSGFPRNKSIEWWNKNTTGKDFIPNTTDEALNELERLMISPKQIEVMKNGKYYNVNNLIHDDIPF